MYRYSAGSAERIYESIENAEKAAMGQGGRRAEEVRALCRRLHPRLPAFTVGGRSTAVECS